MPKMGDKGLKVLKTDEELECYGCKSAPATQFKWMKTPTGGKYKRGWCQSCLLGVPVKSRQDYGRDDNGKQFKIGQEVDVAFSGKVLHFVPKQPGMVVILSGTTAYTTSQSFIEGYEEPEAPDGEAGEASVGAGENVPDAA